MFSTNEEITPSLPDHHLQVLLQGLTVLRVKDIYLSRPIFEKQKESLLLFTFIHWLESPSMERLSEPSCFLERVSAAAGSAEPNTTFKK